MSSTAPVDAIAIAPEAITGLVLAGGRGSRMGGVDKGLQLHQGMPMALYVLLRLQQQVGYSMINANRNLAAYEAMGVPIWPDVSKEAFAGPLAGILVGLEHCETPWLVTVPCDTPNFPDTLVQRLAQAALAEDAEMAMAATREVGPDPSGIQLQPVFCLMKNSLLESLTAFLDSGQRKIDRWSAQHRCAVAVFEEPAAFFNANTSDELRALQHHTER